MNNIEDSFLKFKSKSFPHEQDYTNLYKRFKAKLDKEIHPEVKVKMKEYHPDDYYNDHGIDHIKMVIDRASKIIECLDPCYSQSQTKNKYYISPYEIFILLMSIQIHDAGHVLGSRKEHPQKAKNLLNRVDKGDELNAAEKKIIGDIAKSHSGTDNPIGKLTAEMDLNHQQIRPQFLASILRLADEISEDNTRASRFLIEEDQIPNSSQIYHQYSLSINSIKVSGNEISIKFYLNENNTLNTYLKNEDEIYLIDEIYERTLKTFTEALYCSRFLPEKCRINSIKVTIYIDDKEQEQILEPIAYELKETLYPLISREGTIYEVCPELKNGETKKNGEYFAQLIRKKNEKPI